ncbi:uncharacterized protein FIBRA_02225 [Fibroporia radiculosa]|uniref:Uncharacterized protein n=1 Tax=Fibroporia radiculosa TaxID=599839 RepID=J4HUK2_9APHY|nr:uncharacterized protein FIBRA_02225 [Fibroporia radiculosa]CCM00197.1 predicted protein [Fibroporia radiculosa]
MVSISLLILPTFALVGSATQVLHNRQYTDPCAGLGNYTYPSSLLNFTLSALNRTLPNANATGAPLYVGTSYFDNGTISIYNQGVLTTFFNFSLPPYLWPGPSMSLKSGGLYPLSYGSILSAVDNSVAEGGEIGFLGDIKGNPLPPAAEIYCIQQTYNLTANAADKDVAPSPLPLLAVYGDTGNFSICTSRPSEPGGVITQNVVYKPISNSSTYYYDTCYSVNLQVLYEDA